MTESSTPPVKAPVARKPRPRTPQIPGLTPARRDWWIKKGYLRPGLEFPSRPAGSGNRWVWSDEEIRVATDMVRLRKAGYTLATAAKLARQSTAAVEAALAPHAEKGVRR